MRSPFRDKNRFQRDGVIVPLLTIELQFMKYGRSQFDKRPENEVDHLLITNTNISYMLPVITEAVKTLVKNAGCYEEGGTLKNRTRLCEEIRYNHSNVRIAELYE